MEPLKSFYKDEVREIGRELGLPAELLDRHPFPGPGLAIRCLCSEFDAPVRATADGVVIPVHSVGVQGDARSYAPVLAIDTLRSCARHGADQPAHDGKPRGHGRRVEDAAAGDAGARLLADARAPGPLARGGRDRPPAVARERLRPRVWQFPVILIPLGTADAPDSIVLRPVDSVDGMTAQSVPMDAGLLRTDLRESSAGGRNRGRVLRSDAQAARHDRVGVSRSSATLRAGSFTSRPEPSFSRFVNSRSTSETDTWL